MSRYVLIRWAGLAGLVSGPLIIAGAVAMTFAAPVVSGVLFVTGHILLFFLLTGVYAAYSSHAGILGLLGYVLATVGNSLFVTFQFMVLFFISGIEGTWVLGAVDLASPALPGAVHIAGLVFGLGLLLIAIAITRIKAPTAWAGWLMFLGTALNLVLSFLPGELPVVAFAIPPLLLGFGVAGFGWGLRRN
jgi:hypothetical protein